MDYESRLSISFYHEVAVINQEHHITLVQHIETHKFFVKKILDVYNINIYRQLKNNPIKGMPRIYELYEENAQLTIIEEYISGQTLEEQMLTVGNLSELQAADYMVQLCDILSQLHHLTPSIIHRDIKPSNVMITSFGNIVLLDLNTAKYADSEKNADTVLLGTKGYAAPEQYGFGSSSIQTDIYGSGVLFNILLTGKLPGEALSKGAFAPIITKSTQLRPEDRYRSIDAMKMAILEITSEKSVKEPFKNDYLGSFLPPGYRSKNLFHMLLATFGYASIFYFGGTLTVENAAPSQLLIERIFFTAIMLFIVFFNYNYRNVHSFFPFCTNERNPVRYLAIICFDFLIFLTMMILMSIVETIFV